MLEFKLCVDPQTKEKFIETSIHGKNLLTTPQLNKGTSFTVEERQAFALTGKLPHRVEAIDEQLARAYLQLEHYDTPLQKNIYLNNLHDKNQILFYSLIRAHLNELIPIIYTPTVGLAVQAFSREYRQARGLYISHTDQDQIEEILSNRSNPEIDLIVITDGEGVLGIGDQGIGGMDIPVAKLMVYSACGGIDPTRTLPIFLDVGTNNTELLEDPLYLGCRHNRIYTEEYDKFIHKFITKIKKLFPHVFLHWEDFGRNNARRMLDKYENELCTFNDDVQGTGVVTLAALLAASKVTNLELTKHRIVVFGAGTAGTGISDQIVDAMIRMGLTKQEAYDRFWLVDRQGLLVDDDATLTEAQQPYARKKSDFTKWSTQNAIERSLSATVAEIKPTILIGCSAQTGRFTQEIIQSMAMHCERPIIFPLSNPNDKCEAQPIDIVNWTEGKALIATGTAFGTIHYQNRIMTIAQCNNALAFPGIGLGLIAVKAKRLTADMLWAAAIAISEVSPSKDDSFLPVLPAIDQTEKVSKLVAIAVAQNAIETGMAQSNQKSDLNQLINELFWKPTYLPFKRVK
ncbi:MAG: NAD-dependent malic enzyme [Legionellaceae bacterium]|nr:NAD-dependent malic enzyme [Legionellaceae bacterium]